MAQGIHRDESGLLGEAIIGVASVQFSMYDPIYIDSNGYLALATAGSKCLGVAQEYKTTASTNATVEKYCVQYSPAEGLTLVFGSDQDCTQTDIGAYADFGTATTGAFNLNLAAGSTGTNLVLAFDPTSSGDLDAEVIVKVAESQLYAFAQS